MPTFENLDEIDLLLSTTKAVRRRLDLSRPVPREVVVNCIRLACFAPNGMNGQDWRWVIVDDPDQRRRIGALYRRVAEPPVARRLQTVLEAGDEAAARTSKSVLYLAEHIAEVPMMVIPCFDVSAARSRFGAVAHDPEPPASGTRGMSAGMYASILPAVWSFQLALRSRGLGSVLTTVHQTDEDGMAEILGIPSDWAQVALIPVAYTIGDTFSPSHRRPVEEFIIWNRLQRDPSS